MVNHSAFLGFISTLSGTGLGQLNQLGLHIPGPVQAPPIVPLHMPLPVVQEQEGEEVDEEQGVDLVSMTSLSSSICHELYRRWGRAENEEEDVNVNIPSSPPRLRTPLRAASNSSGSIVRQVMLADVFGSSPTQLWTDEEAEPSSVSTPLDVQINVNQLAAAVPTKVNKWVGKTTQLLGKLRPTHAKILKQKPSSPRAETSPQVIGDPFRRLPGVPEPEDDAVVRQRLMEAHDWHSRVLKANVQLEVAVARRLASGTTPLKEKRKWWKFGS